MRWRRNSGSTRRGSPRAEKDAAQLAAVRDDIQLAESSGITSTPSFMVGRVVDGEFEGERFSGAKPYAEFAARIDALLAAGQ